MDAFAGRATDKLAATGEERQRGLSEAPDDLTAHERHIAALARDGLSNGLEARNPNPTRTATCSLVACVAASSGCGVLGGGQDLPCFGLVSGCDEHPNTAQLELRLLATHVIGRHSSVQAIALQQADDKVCLDRLAATATDTGAPPPSHPRKSCSIF
jgi:hypothetical protein